MSQYKRIFTDRWPRIDRYYEIVFPTDIKLKLKKNTFDTKNHTSRIGWFTYNAKNFIDIDEHLDYKVEWTSQGWYLLLNKFQINLVIYELLELIGLPQLHSYTPTLPVNKACLACYIDSACPLELLKTELLKTDEALNITKMIGSDVAKDWFGIEVSNSEMIIPRFEKDFIYKINGQEYFFNGDAFESVESPIYTFNIKEKVSNTKNLYITESNEIVPIEMMPRTVANSVIIDTKFELSQGVKYFCNTFDISDINYANLACLTNFTHVLDVLETEGLYPDQIGANCALLNKNLNILTWLASRKIYPNNNGVELLKLFKDDTAIVIYLWKYFPGRLSLGPSEVIDKFILMLTPKELQSFLKKGFIPSDTLIQYWNRLNIKHFAGYQRQSILNTTNKKKLKVIGSGINATVYLVDDNYVIKTEFVPNIYIEESRKHELEFYNFINSMPEDEQKHFVKLYDYTIYNCKHKHMIPNHLEHIAHISNPNSGICIDYLLENGGTTLEYLFLNKQLTKDQIKNIIFQIIKIFEILKKYNYGYDDLHMNNILVTSSGIVKLIDYGIVPSSGFGGITKDGSIPKASIIILVTNLNGLMEEPIQIPKEHKNEFEKYKPLDIVPSEFMNLIYPISGQNNVLTSEEGKAILDLLLEL